MFSALVFKLLGFRRNACLQATKTGQHSSTYQKSSDLAGFGPVTLTVVWSLLLQHSVIGPEGSAVFPSLSVLASCLAEGASLPRVSYLSPQDLKGTPRQLCLGLCILKVCPWKTLSSCGTWASAGSVLLRKASNFYSSQNPPKIGTLMCMAGKSVYMESLDESEIEYSKATSRRLYLELLL